jgi:arginyl-tRNA synthetase
MITPQSVVLARLRDLGVGEEIVFNTPPRPDMGDFSTPIALKLARSRGKSPMVIAEELCASLSAGLPSHIRDISVSRPGFLNFFLDDASFARDLLHEVQEQGTRFGAAAPGTAPGKTLIEHTNVNPNKAMHVGHVRNAVLGDTVVRALRSVGHRVEVCNYIDDTGVQVVDVVTAFLYLDDPIYREDEDFAPVWDKASEPFDYYCWDIYSRVQDYLKPEPNSDFATLERARFLQERKQQIMHAVEDAHHPIAAFARELAARIVGAHLATAARLNVFYDLLNWESDILGAGFWKHTFDRLRDTGAIRFEESGPNAGCWVVPMGGIVKTDEGDRSLDRILVRSNGAATYTAKDIAYQLWKFGRQQTDFSYKEWGLQPNGEMLFTTCSDGHPMSGFGQATRVINVIDVRQSEPQTVVRECLEKVGFQDEAQQSVHLGYEVVKLSNAAARELGVDVEVQGVSMSGRKGLGVKANDLFDRMVSVIRAEHPDPALDAESLAAAAIRYYMLKFSTNTIINFDFKEASQTRGDTGVYLVYSYARACGILKKATGTDTLNGALALLAGHQRGETPASLTADEKQLTREMAHFGEAVQQAADTLSTTPLTTYAFSLASAFAGFYDHTPPILHEQDPGVKAFRLDLVAAFRQVMNNTLDLLGIPALERMPSGQDRPEARDLP